MLLPSAIVVLIRIRTCQKLLLEPRTRLLISGKLCRDSLVRFRNTQDILLILLRRATVAIMDRSLAVSR